jgi:hypothetical protein
MTSPWQPPDSTPAAGADTAPPKYGEMAPPGYVSPVPQPDYVAPTYYLAPPVVRKSRTADVAVTSVLLALGAVGMFAGVSVGLTLHQALAGEAAKYGVTYDAPANLGALAAIIVVSHVVLFLAALGVSIPLLIARRVAFWVPLVAGVVAAIILWVILISLTVGDTALIDAISSAS